MDCKPEGKELAAYEKARVEEEALKIAAEVVGKALRELGEVVSKTEGQTLVVVALLTAALLGYYLGSRR